MKYSLNLATGIYINHKRLFVVLLLVVFGLLGLLIFNGINFISSTNRISQLEVRLEELRRIKRSDNQNSEISGVSLAETAAHIGIANEILLLDSYRWTSLLDQLEAHVVDGISISGLQPDYKSGTMKLSGRAETIDDLRKFIDSLSQSDVFTHVFLKDQRAEKTKDDFTEAISFSVEFQKRGGV